MPPRPVPDQQEQMIADPWIRLRDGSISHLEDMLATVSGGGGTITIDTSALEAKLDTLIGDNTDTQVQLGNVLTVLGNLDAGDDLLLAQLVAAVAELTAMNVDLAALEVLHLANAVKQDLHTTRLTEIRDALGGAVDQALSGEVLTVTNGAVASLTPPVVSAVNQAVIQNNSGSDISYNAFGQDPTAVGQVEFVLKDTGTIIVSGATDIAAVRFRLQSGPDEDLAVTYYGVP